MVPQVFSASVVASDLARLVDIHDSWQTADCLPKALAPGKREAHDEAWLKRQSALVKVIYVKHRAAEEVRRLEPVGR